MRAPALLVLTLSLGSTLPARPSADGFDEALTLAGRGEFVAAVQAAQTIEDPLRRAQAMVWTHEQAGDWVGADRLAQRALKASPHDPWLAERRATIALTLGRSDLAAERLATWEAALSSASLPRTERRSALERLGRLQQQSAELQEARTRRDLGITRARGVTSAACLLFILAVAFSLRDPR